MPLESWIVNVIVNDTNSKKKSEDVCRVYMNNYLNNYLLTECLRLAICAYMYYKALTVTAITPQWGVMSKTVFQSRYTTYESQEGQRLYVLHPMQQCTHRRGLLNDDICMEKREELAGGGQCQGGAASLCQFQLFLHRLVQKVPWRQKGLGCSQE